MKNTKWIAIIAFALLATFTMVAQDVPKFEVPVTFSFINVHPNAPRITSFNVFGGGGALPGPIVSTGVTSKVNFTM